MTEDVARRALELAAAGATRAAGIVLFGGEPLLHPELIVSIVARARAMTRSGAVPFHFKVTTNGVLLDDAFVRFAVQEDVSVAVSCDGIREAHDLHRRLLNGGPSYAEVRGGLLRLLRAKPYSPVLMVVRPDTARWLTESVSELLELGCRYLVVSLDHAAGWDEAGFEELARQYDALGRHYVAWTRAGRKFYLSPFEVKIGTHLDECRYRADRCELGTRQLSVDPSGKLYPCVQFTRAGPTSSWCVGDVETGISTASLARIRAHAAAEHQPCRACAIRQRCNHTCGCLNWQATGSVNEVSEVLCRSERMLVPIADRIGAELFQERNALFLHKHYNPAWPLLSLLEETKGWS